MMLISQYDKKSCIKSLFQTYKGTFLLISKLITEIIKTETETSKKKTRLNLERSNSEKKGITLRIPCNSIILFKKEIAIYSLQPQNLRVYLKYYENL